MNSFDCQQWDKLRIQTRELKNFISTVSGNKLTLNTPIEFRKINKSQERLYFLSSCFKGSTIYYMDVYTSKSYVFDDNIEPKILIDPSFYGLNEKQSLADNNKYFNRDMCCHIGIKQCDFDNLSGKIVFSLFGSIFYCLDDVSQESRPLVPKEIKSKLGLSERINPKICPFNSKLIAFVFNRDIWVTNLDTMQEIQITNSKKLGNGFSAGLPSYVMQEEFNRYDGFWWKPNFYNKKYCLLYEEIDESDVEIMKFYSISRGITEEFRYPRSGHKNAKSRLMVASFTFNDIGEITQLKTFHMPKFIDYFPWVEYIVRIGWLDNENAIWAQMLNRRQKYLELVMIPLAFFIEQNSFSNEYETTSERVHTLHKVQSESYIKITDILSFISTTSKEYIKFIWASEQSGHCHLYLITSYFSDFKSKKILQLTYGPWSVSNDYIWVNSSQEVVFFQGFKDNPLEKHFYVLNIKRPGHLKRLTALGYSHSVSMNKACSLFVTNFSNLISPPASQIYQVFYDVSIQDCINILPLGWIIQSKTLYKEYVPPEIFEYTLSSGEQLFGMIFKPANLDSRKKYPIILNIYGGPGVQLVTNSFKGLMQIRNHVLASQGFCVIFIDSRGSKNRGKLFEEFLHKKMGQVELKDQVEVLQWLGKHPKYGYVDMSRVAIHGWSYGGYLSLMALIQYPKLFKIAVAGAPVVDWQNYDTGYTERYMDMPYLNPKGYELGSVLKRVQDFPDECNRLLIFHGLMDENVSFLHHTSLLISQLIKHRKPYQLQIYPEERHSLRKFESNEHYELALISFLHLHL